MELSVVIYSKLPRSRSRSWYVSEAFVSVFCAVHNIKTFFFSSYTSFWFCDYVLSASREENSLRSSSVRLMLPIGEDVSNSRERVKVAYTCIHIFLWIVVIQALQKKE